MNHISLKELKHRNKVIRSYILKRDWDIDEKEGDYPEFQLKRKVIAFQKNKNIYNGILSNYPFIYDYEYRKEGVYKVKKGDFLLTDANRNFLVVECKSLKYKYSKEKIRLSKRKIEKQVPEMMKILKGSLNNFNTILGIGVTDEKEPYYIRISCKFRDDQLTNTNLPNLHILE